MDVIWAEKKHPASQVAHVGCEGESLNGKSPVLYVSEEMFVLERKGTGERDRNITGERESVIASCSPSTED